jgi:hypothetical protein
MDVILHPAEVALPRILADPVTCAVRTANLIAFI